ncbi:MAG: TIGR04290 family methyltransferase, partial [Verrucomicrobia bacterium]
MSTSIAEQTKMDREEIEHRVRDLGQWFHNLNIAGVQTAPDHFLGDYPSVKWQRFQQA